MIKDMKAGRGQAMNATDRSENSKTSQRSPSKKLMVKAFVNLRDSCGQWIEVRRGMAIMSEEGSEVGKVAAVVLDSDQDQATHILLARLPKASGYWLICVDLIVNVSEECVQLNASKSGVESLPRWHST